MFPVFALVYAELAYDAVMVISVALVFDLVNAELEYDCARFAAVYAELA